MKISSSFVVQLTKCHKVQAMSDVFSCNSKVFIPFFTVLNLFEALWMKPFGSLKFIFLYFIHIFLIFTLFAWFLVSSSWNVVQVSLDPLIFYAQSVERITRTICPLIIIVLGIFKENNFPKIIRSFTVIDTTFLNSFKVQIDRKLLWTFVFLSVFGWMLTPVVLFSRAYFRDDFVNFPNICFLIIGNLFLYTYQALVVTLEFSVLVRMRSLEYYLKNTSPTNIEMIENDLLKITFEVFECVKMLNKNFGLIIVMVFGEKRRKL